MSTTKKPSNHLKYFRLSRQSIQGKFVILLSIIASAVGILLAINYGIIKSHYQQQQHLLEVWTPTQEKLQTLSIYLETAHVDQKHVLPALNTLNGLSEKWQNERMIMGYERLLEQLEALSQAASSSSTDVSQLREFEAAKKTLSSLLRLTDEQLQVIALESKGFMGYLKSLFLWEYISYVVIGFILSTIMVLTVMRKIRLLKIQVAEIASGNLSQRISIKNDEFYSIGKSLNQLIDNLKDVTHFSGEVGRGNMDASINAFDEKSELGRSLSEMRDSLKRVAAEEKSRRWVNEGIAKFAQIVRLHNGNVNELAEAVTGELVKYVGALQGALFISRKDSSGNTMLELSGCYAYDRQKYLKKQIPVDSGLIGQAYLEKAPKYLLEIPKNWETITTGLGIGSPESILMVPLLHEDRVEGVLELASMKKFLEHELEFLNRITETLGAAVAAVRMNEETRLLLEESRGVTEELRSQEEEMRQNMEEMLATQEEMARAQKELSMKEANLNAFINNTTDSIITITRDYKVDLINQVLKNRYKGTQYEGIDKGADIMPTLGAVAQEWKDYYDKSFNGEYQQFTIKSSVKGEDSWREYQINPIKSKNGEIVAVSVTSRDTTQKVKFELEMKQKSAVLNKIMEQTAHAYMALDASFNIITLSQGIEKYLFEGTIAPKAKDNFLSLLNDASKKYWKPQIDAVMEDQELVIKSPLAAYEQYDLTLSPVKNDDGTPIAVLLSVHTQ